MGRAGDKRWGKIHRRRRRGLAGLAKRSGFGMSSIPCRRDRGIRTWRLRGMRYGGNRPKKGWEFRRNHTEEILWDGSTSNALVGTNELATWSLVKNFPSGCSRQKPSVGRRIERGSYSSKKKELGHGGTCRQNIFARPPAKLRMCWEKWEDGNGEEEKPIERGGDHRGRL